MSKNNGALYGLYIGTVAGALASQVLSFIENSNRPPIKRFHESDKDIESLLLINFYHGMCPTYENKQHYLETILGWHTDPNGDWENHHGFIQWIFPTPFQSIKADTPILTRQTCNFLLNKGFDSTNKYMKCVDLFLEFIGISYDDGKHALTVVPATLKLLDKKPHNLLRITRLFQSLRCFKRDAQAIDILSVLLESIEKQIIHPPPLSVGLWKVAVFQRDPWNKSSQQESSKYFNMENSQVKNRLESFDGQNQITQVAEESEAVPHVDEAQEAPPKEEEIVRGPSLVQRLIRRVWR